MLGPLAAGPHLVLPLQNYPRKAVLSVLVTDPVSGRILLNKQLTNQLNDPKAGWVNTETWQAAGIKKVEVAITCRPAHGRFFTDHLLLAVPLLVAP